ncbi:hypothetical protein [Streptomyces celluloflavus]
MLTRHSALSEGELLSVVASAVRSAAGVFLDSLDTPNMVRNYGALCS